MYDLNQNFSRFPGGYLFAAVRQKKEEFQRSHPDADVISLGIGDVTKPLCPVVMKALEDAAAEMGDAATFRGYGPYEGYAFLREAIARVDFQQYGVKILPDEIFVGDGAKSDLAGITDLFSDRNRIAICEPTYPAYADSNVVGGRCGYFDEHTGRWTSVMYLDCTEDNGFVPEVPGMGASSPDIIYLCFPNNPTGVMITRSALQRWVNYALEKGSVILYDAAYNAFIETPDAPHTIYECAGAEQCAIELRSFSKTAGFTGMRLSYMVIPAALRCGGASLRDMWKRRLGARYNGAPYIIQRAGAAVYTPEGQKQTAQQVAEYKQNTKRIRTELEAMGYTAYGGTDAPYVWMKLPAGMKSWDFFDLLLTKAGVVGTPGVGFGADGEGFFRFTGFGTPQRTEEALARIAKL